MITTSHLIGDLAADHIRTLLADAEADRLGRLPAARDRSAPARRWSRWWGWRRAPVLGRAM